MLDDRGTRFPAVLRQRHFAPGIGLWFFVQLFQAGCLNSCSYDFTNFLDFLRSCARPRDAERRNHLWTRRFSPGATTNSRSAKSSINTTARSVLVLTNSLGYCFGRASAPFYPYLHRRKPSMRLAYRDFGSNRRCFGCGGLGHQLGGRDVLLAVAHLPIHHSARNDISCSRHS